MKPPHPAKKFMIPWMVPAKFGDKSCGFIRVVSAAAPLNPSIATNRSMAMSELWPMKRNPQRHKPVAMWAGKNND